MMDALRIMGDGLEVGQAQRGRPCGFRFKL